MTHYNDISYKNSKDDEWHGGKTNQDNHELQHLSEIIKCKDFEIKRLENILTTEKERVEALQRLLKKYKRSKYAI